MYDNKNRECPFGGHRFELSKDDKAGKKEYKFGGYPFRWWLLGRQEVK